MRQSDLALNQWHSVSEETGPKLDGKHDGESDELSHFGTAPFVPLITR